MGTTLIFSSSENKPSDSDRIKIYIRGRLIAAKTPFGVPAVILSCPGAEFFRLLMMVVSSSSLTGSMNILLTSFSFIYSIGDTFCHYGIRGNTLRWFQSYLTQRKQYVTYNSTPSSIKPINCGMPQGSIPGPLLILLFILMIYQMCANIQCQYPLLMIRIYLPALMIYNCYNLI